MLSSIQTSDIQSENCYFTQECFPFTATFVPSRGEMKEHSGLGAIQTFTFNLIQSTGS